jgi:hypothetical protein
MLSMLADQQAIAGAITAAAISFLVIITIGITKIRLLVIDIAQWCAALSLALSTIAGSVAGYQFGAIQAASQSAGRNAGALNELVYTTIGGLVAFVIAAIPFSIIFLLVDISINTRRHEGAVSNETPVATESQTNEFERNVAKVLFATIIAFVVVGIMAWLSARR